MGVKRIIKKAVTTLGIKSGDRLPAGRYRLHGSAEAKIQPSEITHMFQPEHLFNPQISGNSVPSVLTLLLVMATIRYLRIE